METKHNRTSLIEAITPTEARKALGGISRATEHRWQKRGILKPTYIGARKIYKVADINAIIERGAA